MYRSFCRAGGERLRKDVLARAACGEVPTQLGPGQQRRAEALSIKSAFQNPNGVERCEQREDGFRQGVLRLGCLLTLLWAPTVEVVKCALRRQAQTNDRFAPRLRVSAAPDQEPEVELALS
jgi:hypothetical protein